MLYWILQTCLSKSDDGFQIHIEKYDEYYLNLI